MVLLGTDGHPDYPPTVGDAMATALSGTESDRLLRILKYSPLSRQLQAHVKLKPDEVANTLKARLP